MCCGGMTLSALFYRQKTSIQSCQRLSSIEMTQSWNARSQTKRFVTSYIQIRNSFLGQLSSMASGLLLLHGVLCHQVLFSRRSKHHEETEGLFTYRIADHRGHRHSELDAVAYGRE